MIKLPVEHTVDPAWVPDAPLQSSYGQGGLHDVLKRRYLLRLLVGKELQARYSGSVLGLMWSYVMPLWRFAMYYFVIGIVLQLHDDIPNFPIHLFSALVFVHFFTESFNAGTRSIIKNKALVRKMAMPREMFPVASMLVSAFHIVPGLVILTVACVAVGWTPDFVGVLAGLLGFAICAVLGTALALLFSAANVFFRDFANVVNTLTIFVTFSVPMIYPYSMVEERFSKIASWVPEAYLLNPIAEAVLLNQRCFWVGATDDPAATAATDLPDQLFQIGLAHLGVALLLLLVAQLVFSRLENKFAERL